MPEITKISHGLTIGDLKYGNARPGVVEATLKPGETLEEALDELDERLTAWHKKRYPHLYGDPLPLAGINSSAKPGFYTQEQIAEAVPVPNSIGVIKQNRMPEDQRIAALIADIYSCFELKVLESYRIMAKANPELQAAYDMQYKILSK